MNVFHLGPAMGIWVFSRGKGVVVHPPSSGHDQLFPRDGSAYHIRNVFRRLTRFHGVSSTLLTLFLSALKTRLPPQLIGLTKVTPPRCFARSPALKPGIRPGRVGTSFDKCIPPLRRQQYLPPSFFVVRDSDSSTPVAR